MGHYRFGVDVDKYNSNPNGWLLTEQPIYDLIIEKYHVFIEALRNGIAELWLEGFYCCLSSKYLIMLFRSVNLICSTSFWPIQMRSLSQRKPQSHTASKTDSRMIHILCSVLGCVALNVVKLLPISVMLMTEFSPLLTDSSTNALGKSCTLQWCRGGCSRLRPNGWRPRCGILRCRWRTVRWCRWGNAKFFG